MNKWNVLYLSPQQMLALKGLTLLPILSERPKEGQYVQIKKVIPGSPAEPEHNYKGHPEVPLGTWLKVTGIKMDRDFLNLEYKVANETYNFTHRLYPDEYSVMPVTDDTEVARILYGK